MGASGEKRYTGHRVMTRTVLYIDTHDHPSCREKFAGVRHYARTQAWQVVRRIVSEHHPEIADLIARDRPVGCIVNATRLVSQARRLNVKGLPTVFLDTDAAQLPHAATVIMHDSRQTGVRAAGELLSLGLERFYYAPYPGRPFWCHAREAGFAARLKEDGRRATSLTDLRALCRMRNVGILAANDQIALALLPRLKSLGLRVPQDVALIAADDMDEARRQGITSIRIDFEQSGFMAADALAALLEGRPSASRKAFGDVCVQRRESTRHFARKLPRIPDAVAYIREKACTGCSAQEIVRFIGGSRRHAETLFRQATGHSILKEIQSVRLDAVFAYLANRNRPLAQLAEIVGFKTDRALRKAFHAATGMSPREWRERLR